MLTAKRLRELLLYDPATGDFFWLASRGRAAAGAIAGLAGPNGYWRMIVDGRFYRSHRLAWLYAHGRWPSASIDHINGDRGDNRLVNLREATQSQNLGNSRKKSGGTSRLKGVSWHVGAKQWQAQIAYQGKRFHLGCYPSEEAAHAAYVQRATELFGEFANDGTGP